MKAKAVLVTGAAKRVGRALALACADLGFAVIGHYHRSKDEINSLSLEVKKRGVPFYAVRMDLSRNNDLLDQCRRLPVQLFGLVNNASVFEKGNFRNLGTKEAQAFFELNALTPLRLMNDFAKQVNQGFIINLLDANSAAFNETFEVYRLSKRFLRDLTLDTALLYAPGIRVNAIAPGAVLPSKFTKGKSLWKKLAPLQTGGSVEEICRAFRYLVENQSVTGQILYVDGGLHLKAGLNH